MGILELALRYLVTRRVALLAIAIIAVGVMSMIVVVSLMDGVQGWIIRHFQETQADITVLPRRGGTSLDGLLSALEPRLQEPGATLAGAGARLVVPALIIPGSAGTVLAEDSVEGIRLVGIDFERERTVTDFGSLFSDVSDASLATPKSRRSNPLRSLDGRPSILLGDTLAALLGVTPDAGGKFGGTVTILPAPVHLGRRDDASIRRQATEFRVAGCFSSGRSDYDKLYAFVDRQVLRAIREPDGSGPEATSVHLKLVPGADAEAEARSLSAASPNWEFTAFSDARRQDLLMIRDQKRIMMVILSFIIAVAAVAITGLVFMTVVEKTRDIGILRSMGLSRTRMVATFTLYGLLIGVLGSLAGLALGLKVANNLDAVVGFLSKLTGVRLLDPEVYRFKKIPVLITPGAVWSILATTLAMSLVSALVPASKAGLMAPVRCLRSE